MWSEHTKQNVVVRQGELCVVQLVRDLLSIDLLSQCFNQ